MNMNAADTVSATTPAVAMPAPKPGIYSGIANRDYQRGPGISNSGLGLILDRSPLHYFDRMSNPDDDHETPAKVLGSALHKYILEPLDFDSAFVTKPEGIDKRTKDGKARWADFALTIGSRTVIDSEQKEMVRCMAASVMNHPVARKIFEEGAFEQTMYWCDPATGVLCRSRPDWLRQGFITDLKSCLDASVAEFQKSVWNYNYHRQAAHYLNGLNVLTGEQHNNFLFLAVENDRPHAVALYSLDDDAIAKGREEVRRGIETYARCVETGSWPGYGDDILPLSLPAWAMRK